MRPADQERGRAGGEASLANEREKVIESQGSAAADSLAELCEHSDEPDAACHDGGSGSQCLPV